MKKILLIIFMLYAATVFGQDKSIKKPAYVIVVNDEIITQEQLNEYGKKGLIKSMNKGVSQEERDRLAQKHGEQIGDREFVIQIVLLSSEEVEKRSVEKNMPNEGSQQATKHQPEETNNNESKLKVGDTANEFTVSMINGEKITLSDLKGKVVLVNYWATWCAPCLMELADMPEKVIQPFEDEAFAFIPISIGEDKDKVARKIKKMSKYGVNFNSGFDPNKEIWNQYTTGTIPTNYLIDKNGVIRYISIGNPPGSLDKIVVEIQKLLSE